MKCKIPGTDLVLVLVTFSLFSSPLILRAQSGKVSVKVAAGGTIFSLSEMKDFVESYGYGKFERGFLDIAGEVLVNYEIEENVQIGIGANIARGYARFRPQPSNDPHVATTKWIINVVGITTRAQYAFPEILGNITPAVGGGGAYYFPTLRQESNYSVSEDPPVPSAEFIFAEDKASRLALHFECGAEAKIASSLTLFTSVSYIYCFTANRLPVVEQRPNFVSLRRELPLRLSHWSFTMGIGWHI